MYNKGKYDNVSWLRANCTKKLLSKLKRAYEYDPCPTCYAGWLFRSNSQDGPSNRTEIISVTPIGNNKYKYSLL